jgi:hypothetical protein
VNSGMTSKANDHTSSLQAGIAKAIRGLRSRDAKLTQLDHFKLHSLLHNLRATQADTGHGACVELPPNVRAASTS